ncbi:EGF-like domain-containing protein 1 [Diachasmimorpha longicaudata]
MRCNAALLCTAVIALSSFAHTREYERTRLVGSPDTPSDIMARNILDWIQGIYRQGARKTRQESNGYLPPYGSQRPPEKPRPFQPAPTGEPSPSPGLNEVTGYPSFQPSFSSSPRPTYIPPSSSGFTPSGGYPSSPPRPFGGSTGATGPSGPPVAYPGSSTTYLPPSTSYGYPSTSGYPSSTPSPGFPTPSPGGYPSPGGGGTDSYGYPSPSPFPGFPTPTGPGVTPGRPGTPGGTPGVTPGRPGTPGVTPGRPGTPGVTPGRPGTPGGTPGITPGRPGTPGGTPGVTPGRPGTPGVSPTQPPGTPTPAPDDDDLKHPPHIHELQVECSKTMMTINIEFNRQFDGVIYSKGFYGTPECRYVAENSGQTKYSFTVSLDSCGTEFINDFEGEAGQSYLENVLVLQNEPGIQEVWDTVRRVRCLWEGNIKKPLTVSLSVDMLNQEIVTFSGDTATAKLDIQVGKGPFAPAASGLVKIGEPMTLVVSVEGDPAFDLQVRDCVARDEDSTNVVQLTDERGCILKPKLFGAFQKTKETMNTGASIIAYAFFQAFKFPDVMDLFIECNVELCKTDCEACPEANQQIEPGRRRRDLSYAPSNVSSGALSQPLRMSRGFRVIMPDDLSLASSQSLESLEETAIAELTFEQSICMSYTGFYTSFSFILSILVITTSSAAVMYLKLQKISREKNPEYPLGVH